MKKNRMIKACMAFFLIFAMFIMPAGQLKVQAAEVIATVEGTVMSGTTSELLLLSTKEGKMEIKLDSDTDTSGCKILLPDYKVYVSVSHGSDGYLHAVKITSNAQTTGVSVDTASAATVAGTIDKKTTGDVLYVNTPQGEMQIKLDGTTDMSGCKFLWLEKVIPLSAQEAPMPICMQLVFPAEWRQMWPHLLHQRLQVQLRHPPHQL